MAKISKNQRPLPSRTTQSVGVPQENVLDLRAKSKASHQPKESWSFFKKAKPKSSVDLEEVSKRESRAVELPVNIVYPEQELNFPELELQKHKLTKHRFVVEQETGPDNRSHRIISHKQAYVAVGIFAVLGLVVLAPTVISKVVDSAQATQGDVLDLATQGFASFSSAKEAVVAQDFTQATTDFQSAQTAFTQARADLVSVSHGLLGISKYLPWKGSAPATVDHLLLIGQEGASAGEALSKSAELLSTLDVSALRQDDSVGLTTALVAVHASLREAQDHLAIAQLASQNVDVTDLPADKQDQIKTLLAALPEGKTQIDTLVQAVEVGLGVLGHDQARRYLVLFQNNRELRATGGFLGSFAMIDVDKGVVKKITLPGGGIYDVAGQFTDKIQSPKPLNLVNPYWNIQDANWWPDFSTSAQKVEWFWGKSGGPTVDGVITLTPTVIEDLLRLTGPIDLTETYNTVITSDNFYQTVQLQAEAKFDETNKSKQILADLTPILFNQLFNLKGADLLKGIQALNDSLNQKDILLYSEDPILEREILSAGWGGEVRDQGEGDYLMVVDTNIGGGKTDGVIDETISHHVTVDANGNLVDTVQVTRNDRGVVGDPLTGVNNWDYMRFYVPEGSQLLSAQGFTEPEATRIQQPDPSAKIDTDYAAVSGEVLQEQQTGMRISTEFHKTLFANWVETKPGESTSVTISYLLPFKLTTHTQWFQQTYEYSVLVQKQPGSFDPYVALSMDLPDQLQVKTDDPLGAGSSVGFVLNQDQQVKTTFVQR